MTENITLVFPHQLYEENPCLDKSRRVFIIEDDLFFTKQPFHKQKLVLHRATMKFYADYLQNKGLRVTYIEQSDYQGIENFFKKNLYDENVKQIHFCDPVDFLLSKRIKRYAEKYSLKIVQYENPNFLSTRKQNEEMLGEESDNYLMASYYQKQRKRLQILVENNKPLHGKWSFDAENRKALPKNYVAPSPWTTHKNQYIEKAKEYVLDNFPNNPGSFENFIYPVNFEDARESFIHFLEYRMSGYGPYQDALNFDQPFVNHALLSCALNIGLLQPDYVIDEVLKYYEEHPEIPFSSIEGFIRQVIGWREFIRAIYERHGVKQRTTNQWKFDNDVNLEEINALLPLKQVHEKVEKYGYAHHIERLMLLGNFFLLSEINPDKVYSYFMTYYIDAYDWVMVPNVYGMSQHADGGLMTTKPYISSSNYLSKQGLKRDPEWSETWDALYWRFLFKHRDFFEQNPRAKRMTWHLDKMSDEKLNHHLDTAQAFLNKLKSA